MLGTLNLDGDGQADLVGHGGIYKAAYAYSVENYEYWKRELGRTDLRLRTVRGELHRRGDAGRRDPRW